MATTREVSRRSDITLIEAIDQEIIPTPFLMTWNEWQAWRREFGGRPTRDVDGSTATNKQE